MVRRSVTTLINSNSINNSDNISDDNKIMITIIIIIMAIFKRISFKGVLALQKQHEGWTRGLDNKLYKTICNCQTTFHSDSMYINAQ